MEKFENISELIVALLFWITSHTEYKNPIKSPDIEFINQKELAQMACKKDCEILAYTPNEPKYKIYLSSKLKPLDDICHRAILMHEIIHVLQEEQGFFLNMN